METIITFDESQINENARWLLETARAQGAILPAANRMTTVTLRDSEDSDDVLSLVVDDQFLWSERARKMGVEGLDPSHRSGKFGPKGDPIPSEQYILRVIKVYGDEKHVRRFETPDRIVRAVESKKLNGLEAINELGNEFASYVMDGGFAPRRERGRPTLTGEKMVQTAVWLPREQIDFLKANGNISEQIRAMIEREMQK